MQRRRLVTPPAHVTLPAQTVRHEQLSDYARHRRGLRRSVELLEALAALDVTTDVGTQKELADWIAKCYEDRQGGSLAGLFAKCYLGSPFVDHQLSLAGQILRHFTPADVVPPAFVPARSLARSTAYLYIEVYDDGQLVPIRADGSAAV